MMKNIFFSGVFIMNLFVAGSYAQEIEFPLSCNPVIRDYISKNPAHVHSGLRIRQSALPLPFQDDFSGQGIYPDQQLWIDSDAFVNQTMCDNPISIGVATLDGIDKYGNPHDSNSTSVQPVICDYLTSQPIDLTTVTPADSVYFSFYYQPQGLGDEPEDGDSLVLQFYASDGVDSNWINVWVANGRPDSAFAEVRIKVVDPSYFWGGFQFRFYNYATPNGNRDHWNIDYVQLNKNETYNQLLDEITLVYPIHSYLAEFSAMPYPHYKNEVIAGNNPIKANVTDTVREYSFTGTANISLYSEVYDEAGTLLSTDNFVDLLTTAHVFTQDTFQLYPPPALFPSTPAENVDFFIHHRMETTGPGIGANDTSYLVQHFYNYYAYDDGTAESATGVHVAYSKYAYKFDVKEADSLLGIEIYFNPWGKNVHLDLFSLCLWSAIDVGNNTETLVYQTIDQRPANNDSINGFVDYYFDQAQWVNAGINYIGIIQSSITEIGIGVDHNTDSHDKMFLNYNNQWYQSTIHGTWMMRPIFGKKLSIGVNEVATGDSHFEIYPNPASEKVKLVNRIPMATGMKTGTAVEISIFNMLGEKVSGFPATSINTSVTFDVSSLPNGVYFVQLKDIKNSSFEVKRLVVQR